MKLLPNIIITASNINTAEKEIRKTLLEINSRTSAVRLKAGSVCEDLQEAKDTLDGIVAYLGKNGMKIKAEDEGKLLEFSNNKKLAVTSLCNNYHFEISVRGASYLEGKKTHQRLRLDVDFPNYELEKELHSKCLEAMRKLDYIRQGNLYDIMSVS